MTVYALESELAYLAGLVDGEGCITINSREPGNYQLIFRVSMYSKEPLELLASIFDGRVTAINRTDKRPVLCYTATSDKAQEILEALLPYLRTKKPMAELGIKYWSERTSYRGGRRRIPPDEMALRDSYYQQMQQLIKGQYWL